MGHLGLVSAPFSPPVRLDDGQRPKVALVCMPFASIETPSIQVGLMTAVAKAAGFTATAYHLNLDLAASIGPGRYEHLCGHRGRMTSEWLFTVAAFGDSVPDSDAYFTAFPDELAWARDIPQLSREQILRMRSHELPRFVEDCLATVNWGEYGVVGFSSTFQQNVASLALARRIKARYSHVRIVFGGANMEDVMGPEYLRAFEFIDFVVVGEADASFPSLLRAIAAGEDPDLRGVARRNSGQVVFGGQSSPILDLDALPVPDYEDFFSRARTLGLGRPAKLPFEGSRGCWWGAKHHCTFCGLNGLGMGYRVKSSDRLLAELNELATRHEVYTFDATDNILSPKHITTVFSTLVETRQDFEFFFEVKANLTRTQLKTLRDGGVRRIQPGIESMSSRILKLMKKGATMLQNARVLKWGRYYGFQVNWNLLCGFPGEMIEDYRRQLEVLSRLSHLEPPSGLSRIWLERFSPYFTEKGQYPIWNVRAEASYYHIYPNDVDIDKVAYFFEYGMEDVVANEHLHATDDWVQEWRRRWARDSGPDTLFYRRTRDAVVIDDRRGDGPGHRYIFDGPLGLAYEHCGETARSISEVVRHLDALCGRRFCESEVRGALDEFCSAGLMLTEDDLYFGIALPTNPNW
jgi:ribosomal peptide maturation radical SAM protein 1